LSGSVNSYGLKKQIEIVRNTRTVTKLDMKFNNATLHLRRGIVEFHVKLGDRASIPHNFDLLFQSVGVKLSLVLSLPTRSSELTII
jgi:urease alpha subunit